MKRFIAAQFLLDRHASEFEARMTAGGWRADTVGRLQVARQGVDLCVQPSPQGAVILLGSATVERPLRGGSSIAERCEELSRVCWGRFIALLLDAKGMLAAVYRDPTGAEDCGLWRGHDRLIASDTIPTEAFVEGYRPSIAWQAVFETLHDPAKTATADLLDGCLTVSPGGSLTSDGRHVQAWRPSSVFRTGRAVSEAELRTVVDNTVRTMTKGHHGVLAEISGGLDSAIMASSLRASRLDQRVVWLNTFGPFAESDERAYAQAVADKMRVELLVVERPASSLRSGLDLDHPPSLRPQLNRLDAAYDQLQADLCEAHKLDAILTGKGGDVSFFQTPTSAIFADQIHHQGIGAFASGVPTVLARRLRRSAWRIMRAGLVQALRPRSAPTITSPLLCRDAVRQDSALHPWLADLANIPAAKRQQIAGLAANVELQSPSRRSEHATLLHPALSQPVMEACLATPIPQLTDGGHDRLMARRAFADRLPASVFNRRSKGELGLYYGHVVGANLTSLREHLLDGHLAGKGLIDRDQVEAALQLERLIWQGGYTELLRLALMESWVRAWMH